MPTSRDPARRARQLQNLRNAPPAPPGNRRAVSHGGYAAVARDRLEAREREVFDALAADAPLRDPDGALPAAHTVAVRLLADVLCRLDDVGDDLRAGATNRQIAADTGVSLPTVGLWRANYARAGRDGLRDRPRSGRPRVIDDDQVQRVLAATLEPPADGTTQWSVRRLADATGLSPTTVRRIWREHKLKPHQVRTFKFSKDPQLVEKVVDVVGLYLDPPKGALVLCVDEKTQIQALDRTQPTLPMEPGKAARMTHDYKRNGTTSLYAALEIATGEVTGECYPHHRHQEFLAFLNRLVRAYPRVPLHVVLDNSSTHRTPEVRRWLARHKRVHFHFTPTGASWMNMVETWFSILTRQQVRRGVYHDVPELIAAIEHYIAGYNQRAQPFVWTKTGEQILAKATKHQPTSGTEH